MIQVDLPDKAATLVGELDRVLGIDRSRRVIRVLPLEQALVPLEDLASVSQEVDPELTLVEMPLYAQPAVDSTFPRRQPLTLALAALAEARNLPVAAVLTGFRVLVLLVDLDVRGDPLRPGPLPYVTYRSSPTGSDGVA